jgi:hypothetical protein
MTNSTETAAAPQAPGADEKLRCALTGKPVSRSEAYWAPPLITARDLVTTVISTIIHAPGTLGHVLMAEQPDVPYAPEAREQLAARRSAEQLKLLLLLLAIGALIATPLLLLAFR